MIYLVALSYSRGYGKGFLEIDCFCGELNALLGDYWLLVVFEAPEQKCTEASN